jgi:hypothetical protein
MADGSWIRIKATEAHLDASTVNSIIKDALKQKAISITQMPELRKQIGEKFVEAVTPFVPYKSGALSNSGTATDDGRVYWTAVHRGYNYASLLYDEDGDVWPNGEYNKPTTKDTYPQWVKHVQPGTQEWNDFVTNITPIIKEAFNNE